MRYENLQPEQKIKIENDKIYIYNMYVSEIDAILKAYKGKKVVLKGNGILNKDLVKPLREELNKVMDRMRQTVIKPLFDSEHKPTVIPYISASEYNIFLVIKLSYHVPQPNEDHDTCIYTDNIFYIGSVRDQILTDIHGEPRHLYNYTDNIHKYNEYKRLEQEIKDKKKELPYFLVD